MAKTQYAVAFDLDQNMLQQTYKNDSYQNAYGEIKTFLKDNGFTWQQGSLYIGGSSPVDAIVTVQKLSKKFDWFKPSVTDIRLLRVEENNDLSQAI
ncbi:hypothetical protein [Lactiplantibacillus plantarum]|uniref:hypothetical protein n=1 Tax=Lactiplantibacillus plantarum TaxID=1590 RepID=UPI00404682EA